MKDYGIMGYCCSSPDNKHRWWGLLERPRLSLLQRNLLDSGRDKTFIDIINRYSFSSFLDVACGLGELNVISPSKYVGIDNSPSFLKFASKHYAQGQFLVADACLLPFKSKSFDLVVLADLRHHLSWEQFEQAFLEGRRVSRRYIVFRDPILWERQSFLSRFFYRLDRGCNFSKRNELETFFAKFPDIQIRQVDTYFSSLGLYNRLVIVFELLNSA